MNFVFIFLGVLFGLMALGVPVGIVLMICGIAVMGALGMNDPRTVAQFMFHGLNSFPLMAIPFFILAGSIMSKGGLIRRLVDVAMLVVGRFRGGIGYTVALTSLMFAGLSGSALADAAAIGTMMIPIMAAAGYNKARSGAFIAANTTNTPLIPPSGAFILIGVTCNLSIARLFMGGIVPGVFVAIALMITWYFVARIDGYTDKKTFKREQAMPIIKDAIPAFGIPVLVIGGIRFGWFTPTEAGAFCVVYSLVICIFFYKDLNWKKIKEAFLEAAITTSAVALIVSGASVAGFYMTMAQLPQHIVALLGGFLDRPVLFLFVVSAILFVISMVMDMTPNILIFAPILMPVARAAGIDPYFFAFIMCFIFSIGLFTPPVGTVLFVTLKISGARYNELVYKMLPFLGVLILVLIIYILFPQLYIVPQRFLMGR